MKLIPEDIRHIRKRTGLTVTDFASLVGATYGSVYRWEKGAKKPRGMPAVIIRLVDIAMEKDRNLKEVIKSNIKARGPMYTLYRILDVVYNKDPKPFAE